MLTRCQLFMSAFFSVDHAAAASSRFRSSAAL